MATAVEDGAETFAVDGDALLSEDGEMVEEIISDSSGKAQDPFDMALSELEVLMMDEGLNARVDAFTKQHCGEFEPGDENKLVYTELFTKYTQLVEEYIEQQLGASVASFDMAGFCATLAERAKGDEDLLDHPALEMLFAYSDFDAFKQLMLATKEGSAVEAESGAMCVSGEMLGLSGVGAMTGEALPKFDDEEEEGEDLGAPDLGGLLSISGVKSK